ncbi:uncharacterized protein LOC120943125 [Rana temporaria]|uniref:uncharacterized protein LOC120943125 n=1 Tax=Rana temporaria TaxID=8407 RepID=UPI001AAC7FEE|nr:uncharacterized protein LOC120943125 [Rana temporaria]
MKPLLLSPTCRCLYEELVILFHHHQCEECEETANVIQYITLPLCRSVQAMLSHIKYCRAGMSCKIASCRDSRIIVSHGISCKKDCLVALSLSPRRMEWTQALLRKIGRCSSSSEMYDLEVGNTRQFLFVLFHTWTCMTFHNEPNSLCTLPQCHTMVKMLGHSQSCTDLTGCLYPGCSTLRFLLQHCHNCKGKTCMICHPLRTLVNQLYLRHNTNTSGLQNIPVIVRIPTRSSQTNNWKKKSRKSWRSWKRCEGLWIRRHPYRNIESRSRPAQKQRRSKGGTLHVPSSL